MQLATDIRRFANYDAAAQSNAVPQPQPEPEAAVTARLIVKEYASREDPAMFADVERMGRPDLAFHRAHGAALLALLTAP